MARRTPKFTNDPNQYTGGPHPTSGLSGFPARDYMCDGGSLIRAPFDGHVAVDRPIGWAATQNPDAGFGGQRIYLVEGATNHEVYAAHFGTLAMVRGQRFKLGDTVGTCWNWPRNPGRSHIHLGYEGGDPMYRLIDSDGDLLKATKRRKPLLKKPVLRKVGHSDKCHATADEHGHWQVVRELPSGREKVLFQGSYREAKKVLADKTRWVIRKNQ